MQYIPLYNLISQKHQSDPEKSVMNMITHHFPDRQFTYISCIKQGKHETLHTKADADNIMLVPSTSFIGRRVLEKTLSYLLILANQSLPKPPRLIIHHVINNSLLCLVKGLTNLKPYIKQLEENLLNLLAEKIDLVPTEPPENPAEIFERQNDYATANLLDGEIDNTNLFFYDVRGIHFLSNYPLAPDFSWIKSIQLKHFGDSLIIQPEFESEIEVPSFYFKQKKLFEIFNEFDHWVSTMGIHYLHHLNSLMKTKSYKEVINISEAFHSKKLSEIADIITRKSDLLRIVLIAGPSSSGKTTFSKRLAIFLKTHGLNAIPLSLDNYFIDRTMTPLDEDGKPDFESIYALNLDLLNDHLLALLDGKEIDLPHYDFKLGKNVGTEGKLALKKQDILIIEGIHGLNDKLTEAIPPYLKFKIYISPITPLNLDHYQRISSTDNRMLRRLVRDFKYRGHTAQRTLEMWESVRRGEEKNIFPYQEEADIMFNSALIYELAVIKKYAEPLLKELKDDSIYRAEANRLLAFLQFITPLDDESVIPPTSILREFIGGSSIRY